jgi:hypothetical protein
MSRSLTVFFLLTLSVFSLCAQQFGEITGTVTDGTGAIIPGTQVTVTNTATQQARTATTNDAGVYSIPFLVPGGYTVRAGKSGFKTTTQRGVDVQVGDVARIDFRLELGEMTQVVEVTGGAPQLNTESVALGSVIESTQIVNLPLNGRDYLNLVMLSSNAVGEMAGGGGSGLQGGTRAATAISVAGQRLEFNHYTLDGVENTDPNFNSYIIHPSVDAIQEFKVQTGVYSAEFGRGASQINVNTLPGTNAYHLVAFEFLRNADFDAKQWEQVGNKNPFRRNNYGFTLSGPVSIPKLFDARNRLFFTSNFEALHDRTTNQVVVPVATDLMRAGNFTQISQTIYDPRTRVYNAAGVGTASPYPGNIIPASDISEQALALLKYYPSTTTPGASLNSRNYIRNALSPTDSNQFNQRIDWVQNTRSTWFGRFSWGNDVQDNAGSFVGGDTITTTIVRQGVLANTFIVSPSTVNEARFAWSQFNNDLAGFYANNTNVQATLGIAGLTASSPLAYGIPAVGLGEGVTSYGGITPWITRNDTFQGVESLSMIKGVHSIKVGGEIRRLRYNQWGNQKDDGEFDFDAQSTCNPANCASSGFVFADFMVGLPSQAYRVLSEGDAMMRTTYYAGFVQDDWKVSRKLTLNLGLRYENQRPWTDKYDAVINAQVTSLGVGPAGAYLIPNTPPPIYTRPGTGSFYNSVKFQYAQGQMTQVGDQYMGRGLINPSDRNWGPRLGLAYNPADHWSIRAGFGIFYVQDISNIVFDMARNLGGKDGYVIPSTQRTTYLSAPWITETGSPLCPGWSGVCVAAPQIQATDQNNRTPYVEQYLLNVQRELTHNLVLEVGYLGNEGHHLDRFQVVNQAILPSGPNDHSSTASRRPWPAYGNIQEVAGVVNSNYNALNGKLTQRLTKGLAYTVAFTWSKAIDEGSATRTNGGDTLWPNNSYTLNTMRGPSQFNMPRRFVASYVYDLPFGRGGSFLAHGIAGAIIGGWQLGGILTLADGTPVQGSTLGDTTNIGNLADFPNVTGISPIPTNRSANNYFNAAAFNFTSPSLSYLPGNEGRDVLSTPGSETFNTSLARTIKLHENHALAFRFEAFNTLNHPNWNTPPNDPRSPATFGVVTSAKTMRQLQLALKYSF